MTWLVTGGAGYIGAHVVHAFHQLGLKSVVLDDLSTGAMDNIRHLRASPAFSYTIESAWAAGPTRPTVLHSNRVKRRGRTSHRPSGALRR